MYENELGRGACGFHGYNGNVVVYKLNCDYMDFCEFQLEALVAMLRPYGFDVWQSEEYLNVQDVEGIMK
jgi:hypothetical protein